MKKNTIFTLIALSLTVFSMISCEEETPLPKPRAYPKVVFPEKAYRPFQSTSCDFSFEQPVYANAEKDSTFFDAKAASDCWFNLAVPSLNATLHCSYYSITSKNRFDELIQDAAEMANKHNVRANYIEEIPFGNKADKVYGVLYDIDGPAASPCQFYATDSTHHFLRGALYFKTQSRPDSLAPVIAFMKKDINHLLQTLKWK